MKTEQAAIELRDLQVKMAHRSVEHLPISNKMRLRAKHLRKKLQNRERVYNPLPK